jgi:hypothetical protein
MICNASTTLIVKVVLDEDAVEEKGRSCSKKNVVPGVLIALEGLNIVGKPFFFSLRRSSEYTSWPGTNLLVNRDQMVDIL